MKLFYTFLVLSSFMFRPENNINQSKPESPVSLCKEFPTSFVWDEKKYVLALRSIDKALGPGMKLGFLKCIGGQMIMMPQVQAQKMICLSFIMKNVSCMCRIRLS
ncbi:hypothetical protein H8B09_13020 [Paenibacillus sp. PR3]|uniref:Uncharacterized protein n=1 Tax=Paenibacillus terricola TaxID=2763503 RepID=A0ABR8MYS9_9BACL|nr:hypothetical protein [Paenibacillus terricola]MBD3919679.1 hypothetical protein [Paenibacillus terricola]